MSELEEALEIAGRWKSESAASFGPNKALGILARAMLDARRDALRYQAVKACDWIGLRVDGMEFIGVSNLDAWADAQRPPQEPRE